MKASRKVSLTMDVEEIIHRAVLEGVEYGWRRAHKHTETPRSRRAIETIWEEVVLALDEVVRWPR